MTPSGTHRLLSPPLLAQAQTVNCVAMETLSLEHQIQSVQRHIAFLKKEQMELLHDLHLEILRLQKHCTELTHDLEMKEFEANQQDMIDQELEEKCKIMEAQLEEKEKDNLELRKELRHKESLVAALRSNLRSKERKFLEELKRRSHRVTILNTELQKQTEAAAYLSFQLHATKQKLHSSRQSGKLLSERPPEKAFLPPPCGETRPKKRTQKSHSRRPATSNFHNKGAFKDSLSRDRLSSFEDAEPMPDPALFLYTKRHHAPTHHLKSEQKASASSTKADVDQSAPKTGRYKSLRQASQEASETNSGVRTLGKPRLSSKGEQRKRNSPQMSKETE
ncbi:coiled-coil domain containing 92B [Sceloporus undulatus]|uniref:coiled-coil domain containing 92B n=1 Tax=Sceloporus undulatus TaxID=8520 RepID=UPI001C4B640D|nr:coiled-coil domain containing 92B [Sceloporus undulatus]